MKACDSGSDAPRDLSQRPTTYVNPPDLQAQKNLGVRMWDVCRFYRWGWVHSVLDHGLEGFCDDPGMMVDVVGVMGGVTKK